MSMQEIIEIMDDATCLTKFEESINTIKQLKNLKKIIFNESNPPMKKLIYLIPIIK